MIDLYVTSTHAPPGPVWLAGTRRGLLRVGFGALPSVETPRVLAKLGVLTVHAHAGPLQHAVRSLRAYLEGRGPSPESELDLPSLSPFSRRVLDVVLAIEPGRPRTYDAVARAARSPRGARAVGKVLAANPLPLFIPCHRVVTKEGRLAGYQGGRAWKRFLLELESTQMRLTPPRRRRPRAGGRPR